MGMVVRSNVMAVNAFRQLGMNNSQVSKSLEKLSSGFRINRAGDDASGLAISEKMKAQIKGLETASSNSQDGISLIQTAEGALTEVHDMLNRMVELAGKSANGTMDDTVDRAALQNEVNELIDEINRIAKGTNFNGIKLLDGSLAGAASTTPDAGITADQITQATADTITETAATATTAQTVEFDVAGAAFGADGTVSVALGGNTYDVDVTKGMTDAEFATALVDAINANKPNDTSAGEFTAAVANNTEITLTGTNNNQDAADFTWENKLEIVPKAAEAATAAAAAGDAEETKTATFTPDDAKMTAAGITSIDMSGIPADSAGKVTVKYDATSKAATVTIGDVEYTSQDISAAADNDEITLTDADGNTIKMTIADANVLRGTTTAAEIGSVEAAAEDPTAAAGGLILQIGDTGASFNQMTVSIAAMDATSLGIGTISVGTQTEAKAMLSALRGDLAEGGTNKGAINLVSDVRAKLGALQNRLEHTINNLDVAAENMTAANSRIRDTDMAKQMMEYTKMNVLTQSAQAMLAQANQQPQSVLQLLQ